MLLGYLTLQWAEERYVGSPREGMSLLRDGKSIERSNSEVYRNKFANSKEGRKLYQEEN